MPTLVDLVDAHMRRLESASVEQAVFGSSDPETIAGQIRGFARAALGAKVAEALFYGSSAGCVAGVVLDDGRRVVIKAYQRHWGTRFLTAVRRVQEHLAESGFPCPRPILGPQLAGAALATVEELVADPGMRALITKDEMAASARGLARQVALCRGLANPVLRDHHPLGTPSGQMYPQPHDPLFDFSLRAAEAGWIDELAEAAKAARAAEDSIPTVAHTDWSARNVRIDGQEVVVVYDWDSLALTTESVAAGQAAATWRSTGEASDPIAPGPEEVEDYLAAYEAGAGRPFTPNQRRAALGAALWVLAYTARCEHALEAATGKRLDQGRARLAEDGQAYLQ